MNTGQKLPGGFYASPKKKPLKAEQQRKRLQRRGRAAIVDRFLLEN